ncbi:hypothetical protein D9M71_808610 [compost metagenome]
MQQQLTAATGIIALYRQRVVGSAVAAAQVDYPGVVQRGTLAGGERRDATLNRRQHAAAVDVEGAAATGAVAQCEAAVQVEARAVAQIHCFPVAVAAGAGRCGAIEG